MSDEKSIEQPHERKEDAARFELRARPKSPIRFRRGLLVSAAALVSVSLVGIAWLALDPPSLKLVGADITARPVGEGEKEVLGTLPSTYGDVPKLGPPLPGDLGRPILEHQRELEGSAQSSPPGPTSEELAREERQRLAEEATAARKAPLLVERDRSATAPPAVVSAAEPANGHLTNAGFRLDAGTIISASLITGLNSDLSGTVLAQVTENVRDSQTGRTVLIPQGARLIGKYDGRPDYGQSRLGVIWTKLLLPGGEAVSLEGLKAADVGGFTGLADQVDRHGWRLLKGVLLSTVLSIGGELGAGRSENDLARAIRDSAADGSERAGAKLVEKELDVAPTLTVRPGWPLKLILTDTITLPEWRP